MFGLEHAVLMEVNREALTLTSETFTIVLTWWKLSYGSYVVKKNQIKVTFLQVLMANLKTS